MEDYTTVTSKHIWTSARLLSNNQEPRSNVVLVGKKKGRFAFGKKSSCEGCSQEFTFLCGVWWMFPTPPLKGRGA